MNRNRNQKYTYKEVKEYIEGFGYKLLSDEYINANSKLLILCDKGHKYMASFSKFKNGNRRCPYCAYENTSEKLKQSYEEVKEYIESFGYKLLSEHYVNSHEKILIECPHGHKYEVSFCHFKGNKNRKGSRCPYCNGGIKYSYNFIKEYLENEGYKLLSTEYKNCKEKLILQCPEGHIFKLDFDCFKRGQRCIICHISKGERRIMDWLEENNIEYIYNKGYFDDLLGVGNGLLRPDFIIEDRKIWIEYDGEFHYKNIMRNKTLKVQ